MDPRLPLEPMISVITPALNAAAHIEQAVRSVLAQDYPSFEHIVVDGGSQDDTIAVLQRYPHVRCVSEPDRGQADAMNKGFALSKGEVVVYCNSDDYFLPGAFRAVASHFARGAVFVVGAIQVLDDDGRVWVNEPKHTFAEMLRHWEPHAFPVNPVGYFYRREVQTRVGGFNVHNRLAMDLEFLLAAALQYPFTRLESGVALGVFRCLGNSTTARTMATDREFWTPATFSFLDRFIAALPASDQAAYQRARALGYRQRRCRQLAATASKVRRGMATALEPNRSDPGASSVGDGAGPAQGQSAARRWWARLSRLRP
jgi:glycosyltransferase involved in cell wall biosynthesis